MLAIGNNNIITGSRSGIHDVHGSVISIHRHWPISLIDGTTVFSGGGVVGSDGWPSGITKPTHWWNFSNGYTDSAPVNPLDLVAAGSGNSFGVDWANRATQALSLNGSGSAIAAANHADLDNIGATWSILAEVTTGANITTVQALIAKWAVTGNKRQYLLTIGGGVAVVSISVDGTAIVYSNNSAAIEANKSYLIIATLDGAGNCIIYINGSANTPKAGVPTPLSDATNKFTVGSKSAADSYTSKFTGSINRVAVLKGTAWSQTEINLIQNAWIPCDEAGIYARRRLADPGTITKSNRGVVTTVSAGTWGSEAAGEYGYSAYGLRYCLASTDQQVSPGHWIA